MDELRRNFAGFLLEEKLITNEQLEEAYKIQAQKAGSLSQILLDLGFFKEKDLLEVFSSYLSIPIIRVVNFKIPKEIIEIIPSHTARKYLVLPVGRIGDILTVAINDPLNFMALEDLMKITGCEINFLLSSKEELKQAIDQNYRENIHATIEEIVKGSKIESLDIIKDQAEVKDEDLVQALDDAPIVKLTYFILKKAVEDKASDIFIEPLSDKGRVRFRVDGSLREIKTFPRNIHSLIVSRFKVMANLNITEHRLPQDGRFSIAILGRDVDFRISIVPSSLGEKITLRVLDKNAAILNLDFLGFEDDLVKKLKEDALKSYGMILVCGPTGSGKTTTLYSVLNYIFTPEKNIITVEDPVEYRMAGINQVNVNDEVNLNFASALRSILRQDPDVIMVGEIRDFETVDIAVKSALTGHLVLSTLHTTTAPGSVTRLVNMGVESFLLTSSVIGVLAQRLVRRLCPECKEVEPLNEQLRVRYKINPKAVIYKSKGCKFCDHRGYKGRIVICEYLQITPDISNLINNGENEHVIKQAARKLGMITLRQDGIMKLERGIISLEEVLANTAFDE